MPPLWVDQYTLIYIVRVAAAEVVVVVVRVLVLVLVVAAVVLVAVVLDTENGARYSQSCSPCKAYLQQ